MKDDLGKTRNYTIPQNNKIKAKSTKSNLGDDLIWPINFCMWVYSNNEYKKEYSSCSIKPFFRALKSTA